MQIPPDHDISATSNHTVASTGASTIAVNGEPAPSPRGPPPQCRRKMRRACCCLTFLLMLNLMLTMHISHSICEIMSVFWENDMILMPGGQQTFCNDFCVDLCVNSDGDDFECDVESCLNNCGAHFAQFGGDIDESGLLGADGADEMYYAGDYGMDYLTVYALSSFLNASPLLNAWHKCVNHRNV